jgi:hypothetical protein
MVVPYYRAIRQQGPHAFFGHMPAEEDKKLEVAEKVIRNPSRRRGCLAGARRAITVANRQNGM